MSASFVKQHSLFQSIEPGNSERRVCLSLSNGRANIPARFVTGIDYGADPALGPTDFHAYVEVYLSDRWYLFDPTGVSPPMGLVRLGTGRDAADVSFATMFGSVRSFAPSIVIEALEDPANGVSLPRHSLDALSSHGGLAA